LRVLFIGQTEAFTIVARRELGIRRAPQLRGKRINLGSPGSGERVSMERVMAALGFAPTDFAAARELPLAEQHDALCANELDAIVFTVRHPNGLVDDVVRTCRGVLVDVSGPPIDRLLSGHPEYGRFVIPGNTYISNPEDVATLGVWTAIITTTRLSDTVAYEITKAVFENIEDFRRLHPDFATLVPRDMVPGAVNAPIHAGAVRYYRERGWLP
jgi:TRAP transporter TAXI family solute receptor